MGRTERHSAEQKQNRAAAKVQLRFGRDEKSEETWKNMQLIECFPPSNKRNAIYSLAIRTRFHSLIKCAVAI